MLFWKAQRGTLDLQLKLPMAKYDQIFTDPLNREIDIVLSNHSNVSAIDPMSTLYDKTHCYFGTMEGLYYRDSSHLSGFGVMQNILPLLLAHHDKASTTPVLNRE